jgi:hypothetical protein
VLIGLALLPFAIPILWLIAPVVIGEEPVLSVATPAALSIAASVLCLAVIYTIDWTPATRVKGVLMLVCLAYFAAVGLYFLKKEMVDRIQKATGLSEATNWQVFDAHPGGYRVKMPTPREAVKDQREQPFPATVHIDCYKSLHRMPFLDPYVFVVGSTPTHQPVRAKGDGPKPGTDEWFDRLADEIENKSGGRVHGVRQVEHQGYKGREVEIHFGEGKARFVRVFLIKGRLYYLSAEGVGLHPDEDPASVFFESFLVDPNKIKG